MATAEALAILGAWIAESPLEDLPVIQGELARLSTKVQLRIQSANGSKPVAVEPEDRLLTVEEAAARLGQKKDWLYQHAYRYPFTRKEHGTLRFSNNGISAWIRKVKP